MKYNEMMATGRSTKQKGFTLFELMITIALIAIITGVYLIAANPAGQLASSRNTKRKSDIQTILLAVRQNVADQSNEQFSCSAGPIPTSTTRMKNASGGYNIAPCLVPTYIFNLPFDPSATGTHYTSNMDYDTGYSIAINASTGQITVSAPYAELGKTVSITQ
jgi:prepilin-type N-terminal cleavage/methylation domain-containing protein